MRARVRLININDKDSVYLVLKSMEPEFRFRRGNVLVSLHGDEISVDINAGDLTSLRSLLNGVLKHIYLLITLSESSYDNPGM